MELYELEWLAESLKIDVDSIDILQEINELSDYGGQDGAKYRVLFRKILSRITELVDKIEGEKDEH